jgi:SAM-dependent methyltransferase
MPRPPNFDRVARIYRWAEYLSLGPLLQRTRTQLLPHVAHCRRALLLGDGDGRFLARLLQQNPHLHALAVDTSAAMLHLLRQRCAASAERVETQHGSALDATPLAGTDLIVTHFFLDCLTQLEVDQLAARLTAQTAPGTLWLLSDFAVPQHRALKPLAALYIRALYLAFRILTGLRTTHLPNIQAALSAAGFQRIHAHQRIFGLLYTELWQRL